MRCLVLALSVAGAGVWTGCYVAGTAEEFKWTLEVPKSVEKGAELVFRVTASNAAGEQINGVKYHHQTLWPGGSTSPLRHTGRTGEEERIRARLMAGPATLVVTCEDRSGVLIKVGEAQFEVK